MIICHRLGKTFWIKMMSGVGQTCLVKLVDWYHTHSTYEMKVKVSLCWYFHIIPVFHLLNVPTYSTLYRQSANIKYWNMYSIIRDYRARGNYDGARLAAVQATGHSQRWERGPLPRSSDSAMSKAMFYPMYRFSRPSSPTEVQAIFSRIF